jgi:hypothetical protein
VCARWVPRELKNREKINRMDLSLQHLLRYADEGEYSMPNRVVTGANHGRITTDPNQSMFQCNGNISIHLQPKSSKFGVTPSAGKVMRTVLWDC